MIDAVIRKELKEIIRDRRFRWLAVACALLIVVATVDGIQSMTQASSDRMAAVGAERDNFLQQGAKNPHAAAHFGQYAFRPILLPAAIDPGVSAYMGSMIWLEAHRMNLPGFRPAEDQADFGRVAQMSVAWILQFVVPLLVIVVSFATVAGERERGTLGLALSQGLSPVTLLVGKALATIVALLAVLVPLMLISIGAFIKLAGETQVHGAPLRFAFMGAAYLLYLLGFAGLAVLISSLAPSRRSAFFALTALWLTVTVALPRIGADAAAAIHPTPTAAEFFAGIRSGEGNDSGLADDPRARAVEIRRRLTAELLQQYRVESVEQLPLNFTAVFLQRLEEEDAPIFDFHYDRLWQTYEAQRRLQQWISLLAPSIAVRHLSMALAGTDPFAQRHFSVAAEDYRRAFVGRLNGIQAVDGAGKRFFVAPPDTWQDIEVFDYEAPATSHIVDRHLFDLLVLVLWALLPLGLLLVSARRLRPVA